MYNKYKELKKIYKKYLIIIKDKDKYYSYDKDKDILNYIKFNNNINILPKYSINFIILDNKEILSITKYKKNNYNKYLTLSFIKNKIIRK